jgi:thioredoxin 1
MKKILRFTASWCGPCKMLSKTLEQIKTDVPIEVIDIDENSELATEYNIRSVPTLVIVKDEKEIKRLVGNKPIQELEAFIHD